MIAWFARNDVAANLLLGSIVFIGVYSLSTRTILEVFPEFERDIVVVRMSYRGSTPEEVEEGIVVKIEEAIQDLEGINRILSQCNEGNAQLQVEIAPGYNTRDLLDEIKNRVDTINTFPIETERPTFQIEQRRREVISVVLAGDTDELRLRNWGEILRDELSELPKVTQIHLTQVRPYEISIEITEENLSRYELDFDQVVQAIRRSSLDLPAGSIKTEGGEIRLRSIGQRYVRSEFEEIVLLKRVDGTLVKLNEIATVKDDFEEGYLRARFNGKPCVVLQVFRTGDQNAIELAETIKDYVEQKAKTLPADLTLTYWRDSSQVIQKRLSTLLNSAAQGGLLVMLVLSLFLRPAVALWVCIGIPISFLGALALFPELGITINSMSVFAFILVMGIVVDDAIVTGENIYTHLKKGGDPTEAAIAATREISVPVTFGVLTTMVAFLPLNYMEGERAAVFAQIPLVVIPVLLFSLLESKLILPAHLKRMSMKPSRNFLSSIQNKIADGLEYAIRTIYAPILNIALKHKYLTVCIYMGILLIFVSIAFSGHIRFVFFPSVQTEQVRATLVMPEGTPFELTDAQIERIYQAGEKLKPKFVDPQTGQSMILNILATTGTLRGQRGRSHLGEVSLELLPPEGRALQVSSTEVARAWRAEIGSIPGAKDLSFIAEIGRRGWPIDIQISGYDLESMSGFAAQMKAKLAEYPAIYDIADSFDTGMAELKIRIKPEAELLGLEMADLARQVRQGFFGEQALRLQRGREDIRVMVRYPETARRSIGDLEGMKIRTRDGAEVPFEVVATAEVGQGLSTINRVGRKRTVNITANFNKDIGDFAAIASELSNYIEQELPKYHGLSYSMEGEAREQEESRHGLFVGIIFVLFAIYALLAIPFKSYLQPMIVLSVIPYGIVGAIVGHYLIGISLSIFSLFGLLAMAGVVVNDSLVMVDYINRRRLDGTTLAIALREAGVARFRPILLTSLTTFAGLLPLIFEKSTQAQFLIPMAVTLGFGVLIATFATLLLVPVNYGILEHMLLLYEKFKLWLKDEDQAEMERIENKLHEI